MYENKTKLLFLLLIFLILLVGILLFTVPPEKENNDKISIINTVTGFETKTFEIGERDKVQQFIDKEYPKRYTEKIWEYYDKLSEARERTSLGR